MQLDSTINDELAKLSPVEQEDALPLIEKFYRNLARSRRHEADLLASIASGLNDPHGLGHGSVERINLCAPSLERKSPGTFAERLDRAILRSENDRRSRDPG